MTVIDIILGAALLFGLIRGLMRGLFVEVASLVALIAGVYGAIHFSNFAADILDSRVDWDEKYMNMVAFAITFIVIVVVIALAGKALTKLANFAALGLLNKLLGGLFSVLKIGLILSIVLLVLDNFYKSIPLVSEEDIESSVLYEPVKDFAPMIFPMLLEKGKDDTAEEDDN